MCLLAVAFQTHPEWPLIIAANRDELLARPASPPALFEPGIWAGRDLVAGGTWLAVNQHGVVASLTNLPGAVVPGRRSRGELPLILTRQPSARQEVALSPGDYNPAWILVGDRQTLRYIDLTGEQAQVRELPPGLHVLENRPLEAASPKAELVKERLAVAVQLRGEALIAGLAGLLASHDVPPAPDDPRRPRETLAACVHAGPYGTRSSSIVLVPPAGPPRFRFTDGPPCTSAWSELQP